MAFVTSERHLWNIFRLRTNDGICHRRISSSPPPPRLAGMKSEQYGQEVSFAFDFRAHLIPQLDWLNRSCVRRIGKDSSKCEMRSRGAVVCGEQSALQILFQPSRRSKSQKGASICRSGLFDRITNSYKPCSTVLSNLFFDFKHSVLGLLLDNEEARQSYQVHCKRSMYA